MTGTSFDGIDAALLRTDGVKIHEFGPSLTVSHPPERRQILATLMGQRQAPADFVRELTEAHAAAVHALLEKSGLKSTEIKAIGFHGQTILHRPEERITLQIGDGEYLARATSIDVVDQFRLADIAAGGQGAPLAPIFHQILLARGPLPAAMVNIGGVSNVTWTDGDGLIACDTGPGNARLDDFMRSRCGLDFDRDGQMSVTGAIDENLVATCLQHPFFATPPPKSLDRDEIPAPNLHHLSIEDSAATLCAITADAIAAIVPHLPAPPSRWVISGGGRLNRAIMHRLHERLKSPVLTAEQAGYDGDGMEAYLFAYLAARRLRSLPSSFPSTTGVLAPTVAGMIRNNR